MYLKGNFQIKPEDKAVISTQTLFSQNSAVCVKFWYFLYGKTAGTLRVQYVSGNDGFTSPKSIWMRSGKKIFKILTIKYSFNPNEIFFFINFYIHVPISFCIIRHRLSYSFSF